ncbi:hypothetical protein JCGZ_23288 [Jatropha curcas]|uniref:Pectinesterase inhibitor domain-containing protein n=1 Tax=Jatropha curcas TaxID=180498 RepID=A0A067JTX6_JATCU|nr:putative invertase inhibitor [Jatropha curcas]KDP23455.1 hypothetical protein JCGZ_23288 [Jatropha curcas]
MSPKIFFFAFFLAMVSSSHQASVLVTQSCQKTLYKDFCLSALGSVQATDLQSLTKAALNIESSKGTGILKLTADLIKKSSDPVLKSALTDCSEDYDNALDEIKDSLRAIEAKSYGDVKTWVSAAMTYSGSCEDGFKEKPGLKSPLTTVNTEFNQLCSIILTFTNLL